MPRVVPSQVVRFIKTAPFRERPNNFVTMSDVEPAFLRGVLDLLSQMPDELLTMGSDEYISFVHGKAEIEEIVETWASERAAGHGRRQYQCEVHKNPLMRIREALAKCPDESPAPGTSELNFITDADLRTELQADVGRVNTALSNGEWKATTVLAGSLIESLLLWALQQRLPSDIAEAIASGAGTKLPNKPLENRHLSDYIEATHILKIITDDTAKQARLAKDFRNLIHPGRSQRLAQKCDRATAMIAVAGMELVVRDLKK
jgi:hypothetical protein